MNLSLYNVRTSVVPGSKPLLSDFSSPTIVCYDETNALVWVKKNGVVVPGYTVYPVGGEAGALVDNGEVKYSTVKKQFRIFLSVNPQLSDFTYATMRCYDADESAIYEKRNGQLAKTFVCFPFVPREQAVTQYYVSTTGNDSYPGTQSKPFRTIKECSKVVSGPAQINVAAGTYTSSVFALKEGVSLVGAGAETTIVNMTFGNDNIQLTSATVTNGNQTISGITFNGNMTGYSCIDIFRRSGVTIKDCVFLNFIDHSVFFRDNAGTQPTVTGNKFINNRIVNCSRFTGWPGALWLTGQKDFKITGNYIESVGRAGDNMGFCLKMSHIENGIISDNELKVVNHNDQLQSAFAIECNNVYGNIDINGNTIQGVVDLAGENVVKGTHDYSVYIHDNIIGHPTLTDYNQQGIYLEGRTEISDVRIENNVIKHVANAIRFTPLGSNITQRITINHNNIYGIGTLETEGVGYAIYHGNIAQHAQIRDVSITNNIFDAAYSGTQVTAISMPYGCVVSDWNIEHNIIQGFDNSAVITSGVNLTGTIDELLITHNIIYRCGNGNLPKWWGIIPTNYMYLPWSDSELPYPDPLFTDAENEDYSFKPGSAGINGGTDGENIGRN